MKRAFLLIPCLIVFLSSVQAQTPEETKATIAYLQGLQTANGGFLPSQPSAGGAAGKPSLRATSSALRALKYFGGEARDRKAAAGFVASCFDKASGGFSDAAGGSRPDVFTTAVGAMALVELKLPLEPSSAAIVKFLGENARTFEDIRIAAAGLEALGKQAPEAKAWLEQIAKMRNPDGTYGKGAGAARATGGAVAAVLRLGGKVEHEDNVVKTLKAGQRPDGGFGKEDTEKSDLETSYRVLRSFVMLKQRPDKPEALRAFVAKCRNTDGGYGVAPGQPSSVSGTYFAGIILHWLGEKAGR